MCQLFVVTGKVQGVFFRASTRDIAESMDLKGHAINMPDGSVEVRACGSAVAIKQLGEWLRKGPRLASVTAVNSIDVSCSNPEDFSLGRRLE